MSFGFGDGNSTHIGKKMCKFLYVFAVFLYVALRCTSVLFVLSGPASKKRGLCLSIPLPMFLL